MMAKPGLEARNNHNFQTGGVSESSYPLSNGEAIGSADVQFPVLVETEPELAQRSSRAPEPRLRELPTSQAPMAPEPRGSVPAMAEAPVDDRSSRLTARGAATRERILTAAADLMRAKGVAGTTFDEITAASGTSKSQLYRHFPDKPSLARAVVALRAETVLDANEQQLRRLNSFAGLRRWRDFIVQNVAMRDGAYGCMLGSLASELADCDDQARISVQRHFETWRHLFIDGLTRMIDNRQRHPPLRRGPRSARHRNHGRAPRRLPTLPNSPQQHPDASRARHGNQPRPRVRHDRSTHLTRDPLQPPLLRCRAPHA